MGSRSGYERNSRTCPSCEESRRYGSLLGGSRESGETLAQAARREACEEAGVAAEIGRLVAVSEVIGSKSQTLFLVFRTAMTGSKSCSPGTEIEEVSWKPIGLASRLMPCYPTGV